MPTVLTIGHSNHQVRDLIKMVEAAGGDLVVDVRSSPYSRYMSQFNREAFAHSLEEAGLGYRYLGDSLGGRPAIPGATTNGVVDYEKVVTTEFFASGIEALENLMISSTPVLMCAEGEPLDCHRCLLVGRHLHEKGLVVGHIRKDGAIEPHEQTEKRLVESFFPHPDLLMSPDEMVVSSYRRQNMSAGYKKD